MRPQTQNNVCPYFLPLHHACAFLLRGQPLFPILQQTGKTIRRTGLLLEKKTAAYMSRSHRKMEEKLMDAASVRRSG